MTGRSGSPVYGSVSSGLAAWGGCATGGFDLLCGFFVSGWGFAFGGLLAGGGVTAGGGTTAGGGSTGGGSVTGGFSGGAGHFSRFTGGTHGLQLSFPGVPS